MIDIIGDVQFTKHVEDLGQSSILASVGLPEVNKINRIFFPVKASDLLKPPNFTTFNPGLRFIPTELKPVADLHNQAMVLAQEIQAVTDKKYFPALVRLMADLDLNKIGQTNRVDQAIMEKIGLLALHKVIELIGDSKEKVEFELPSQVTEYVNLITDAKKLMYRLRNLAEKHPIFQRSMWEVAHTNKKWEEQDATELIVKENEKLTEEEKPLGEQIFGKFRKLKKILSYSGIWEKEGLDIEKMYLLRAVEIEDLIKYGLRYLSWYTLFDDATPEKQQLAYFKELKAIFLDFNSPRYVGRYIGGELDLKTRDEMHIVEEVLFE